MADILTQLQTCLDQVPSPHFTSQTSQSNQHIPSQYRPRYFETPNNPSSPTARNPILRHNRLPHNLPRQLPRNTPRHPQRRARPRKNPKELHKPTHLRWRGRNSRKLKQP
ncbi:hypothetical protein BJX70DRAFT_365610 [Aspergillus crustosus]